MRLAAFAGPLSISVAGADSAELAQINHNAGYVFYQSPGSLTSAMRKAAENLNAALLDGSVRQVSNSIDPSVWLGLGTRAGGEPAGNY